MRFANSQSKDCVSRNHPELSNSPRRDRVAHGLVGPAKRAAVAAVEMTAGKLKFGQANALRSLEAST